LKGSDRVHLRPACSLVASSAGSMNPSWNIWRSVLIGLFLALVCTRAFALDPARHISQYGHTAWRVEDGYFGGRASSITQTKDGYIWIGTEAGLFRFDGGRFAKWSSATGEQLPSNFIIALLAARDGSLWIGTDAGLAHLVNQHLVTYQKGGGWIVSSIVEDVKGRIWINHVRAGDYTHPLCQVVNTVVRCYGSEDGVPPLNAGPLALDAAGNLWAGTDTTLLKWRPGSSKVYRPKALQSNAGIDGVDALAATADGSVWVGMGLTGRGMGLQHMVNDTLRSFLTPKLNGETLIVSALQEDHQNNLWVGTVTQGIYRIHGTDVDHYGSADGLSSDRVEAFFEDREGDLWVATSQGIDMFRDLRVTTFSTREGLSEDSVDSVVASRDGTIWIGDAGHLQVLGQDGVSSQTEKALQGHQVTSLLEDHAGRLWAGMDNTLSIYQQGKFSQIKKRDGSPVGVVIGMTEDSEHNIWAETMGPPGTLVRIQDLKVREEFPEPAAPLARKIVADPHSGIWLGLTDGDLARYRSGKAEVFHFPNHPNARVKAMIAASDGSILGATEFGVVGWKTQKKQMLTVKNGLPCDDVTALISDNQADLWLHSQCGLIQIPHDEVQRWWQNPESRLNVRVLDVSDGARPGLGHFSTSTKTPDGRLWFANGSVLQMIDPAHMGGNTVAPPVDINGIVADRKSYSPQGGLRLPPLTRDLEIDYTALSFVVPRKVLFRYMLDSHDAGWQEPGTRRQAFYNDLRPGKYRFRVIACNNDGVWNEVGASVDFSIAPAWYQTTWFRAFCVCLFLLLLWTLYQLRLKQLEGQFHMALEARVDERTRIARALHDTLLQSFNALLLRFQAASNLLPGRPDEAKQRVDSAIEQASNAITEGRDAVLELRSGGLSTIDLAQAISNFGKELLSGTMSENLPAFRVRVEGTPRILNPIVRDEAYRISAEALRNAIRHSKARQIEVEIHYGEQQLRLRIRDDGKGIDPSLLDGNRSPGHWGLRGMRERATLVGGKFEVWSELDSGTEVELSIPAASAYARPRTSRWSALSRNRRS
jgi:signal transduction histidine kinase/ligand-binding sensor domain-containing protein